MMPVFDVRSAGEPVNGLVHFYQTGTQKVNISSTTVNCFEQMHSWTGHHQGEDSNSPDMR